MIIRLKYKKINYITLLFVLTFCFSHFAAVVSDNDGSAFVTKAEFDALKNSFDKQIDSYNTSIDTKIDGAIAAYLSSIKTTTTETLDSSLNKVNALAGTYKYMAKSWAPTTTQEPNGAYATFNAQYCESGGLSANHNHGWVRLGLDNTVSRRSGFDPKQLPTDDTYKRGIHNVISSGTYGYYFAGYSYDIQYNWFCAAPVCGTGNLTGFRCTDNTWKPSFVLTDFHFSNDYWSIEPAVGNWSFSMKSADGSSDSGTINLPVTIGSSYTIKGTTNYTVPVVGQASTSNDEYLLDTKMSNMEPQINEFRFNPYQGYCWTNLGTKRTETAPSGRNYYNVISTYVVTEGGYTPDSTKILMDFQKHPTETMKMSNLIDESVSTISGSATKMYEGIPLCNVTMTGTLKAVLKFHNKSGSGNIYCAFKKGKFSNDSTYVTDTTLNIKDSAGTPLTSFSFAPETEYELNMEVQANEVIWIKAYSETSDTQMVSVESIKLELKNDL